MLFSKEIEIPEDRSKENYYSERIKISKGTVKKVFVLIPVPSAWAVGVSIWHSTNQIWPTSRTEWISGGLVRLEFEENIEIDQPPLDFEVRCYNLDENNKHKIWVGFNIIRPTVLSGFGDFLELFRG